MNSAVLDYSHLDRTVFGLPDSTGDALLLFVLADERRALGLLVSKTVSASMSFSICPRMSEKWCLETF